MMQLPERIRPFYPLVQNERLEAWQKAQEVLKHRLGKKPELSDFDDAYDSPYPPWFVRLIVASCIVLLLAAFTPSAIRIWRIGNDTFYHAIPNAVLSGLVGISIVLLAEIGQVVFSITQATLQSSRWGKVVLTGFIVLCTLIAIFGNLEIARPMDMPGVFTWLEALAPPFVVLGTSFVLKEQLLQAIKRRHAQKQAYQTALDRWNFIPCQFLKGHDSPVKIGV